MPASSSPPAGHGARAGSRGSVSASNPQDNPASSGNDPAKVEATKPPLSSTPQATVLSSGVNPDGRSTLRRSQEKFEEMKHSTPMKVYLSSDGTSSKDKELLKASLKDIPTYSKSFLLDLYKEDIPLGKIKTFLEESPLYDGKRWVTIPEVAKEEKDLYEPFLNVIQAILAGPGKPEDGVLSTRKAVDTHDTSFVHYIPPDPTTLDGYTITKPDLAILATGPSFEEPLPQEGQERVPGYMVGYSNVVAVFDFKRNKGDAKAKQVTQLAVYCREIFFSQPNRQFVRALIITETKFRLLHFDRSGAYVTRYLKINEYPILFVRLVLALSSHDERLVGLDTSVQWTIGDDGRKIAGTIRVRNSNLPNGASTFSLNMDEPPLIYNTIRGPGTTRWNAKDENGDRIYVKDSWRAFGRTPEYELLQEAADAKVEGVLTDILAYEDKIAQTTEYRPKNVTSRDFFNRTFSRVVMKATGPSLSAFTSQLEVVTVLRDAIIGHRNLLIAGILHRDINIYNILITKDKKGQVAGKLCDLATAIPSYEKADVSQEGRVASPLYLSSSVLRSSKDEEELAATVHDYLDDLEAFNLVLAVMLYDFKGVGLKMPLQGPNDIRVTWAASSGLTTSLAKMHFLQTGPVAQWKISPFWSDACIQLCHNICLYTFKLAKEKEIIRGIRGKGAALIRTKRFRLLYDDIDKHYSIMIGYFDAAIVELGRPGGQDSRDAFVHSPRANERKRRHTPDGDGNDAASDGEGSSTEKVERDNSFPNDTAQSPSPSTRRRPQPGRRRSTARSKRALGNGANEDEPAPKRRRTAK